MKFVFNSKIPQRIGTGGITLYPFVYIAKTKEECPQHLIDHEMVHIQQIEKIGVIRFYSSYVWQYLKGRLSGKNHYDTYRSISFEVEAYGRKVK